MRFKCPDCDALMTEPTQDEPAQCLACGFKSAIFAANMRPLPPLDLNAPLPGPIMQDHIAEQYEALARDVKSGAAFRRGLTGQQLGLSIPAWNREIRCDCCGGNYNADGTKKA